MRYYIVALLSVFLAVQSHAQDSGYTPDENLIYRINFGSASDVKILLDKGANPNAISNTGESALAIAIGRGDNESAPMVRALLDKGANPNLRDKSDRYPIVSAVIANNTQIVTELLNHGADYHVKATNGRTLVELAKQNNNPQIEKMIQDRLGREASAYANERSPQRFRGLVKQYAFDSCAYQYWTFVLNSKQEPEKAQDFTRQIDQVKNDIVYVSNQLQQYYPGTSPDALKRISTMATKKIFDILDAMISNNNRRSQGVGTQDDADTRCHKISNAVEIAFPVAKGQGKR